MLEFVLDDGSGWLSAGLWREDAVSRLSPSLSFVGIGAALTQLCRQQLCRFKSSCDFVQTKFL